MIHIFIIIIPPPAPAQARVSQVLELAGSYKLLWRTHGDDGMIKRVKIGGGKEVEFIQTKVERTVERITLFRKQDFFIMNTIHLLLPRMWGYMNNTLSLNIECSIQNNIGPKKEYSTGLLTNSFSFIFLYSIYWCCLNLTSVHEVEYCVNLKYPVSSPNQLESFYSSVCVSGILNSFRL